MIPGRYRAAGSMGALVAILLSGCATVPPADKDLLGDFRLPTSDGDTLSRLHWTDRSVAFLFVDPTCPLVQDAAQPGGLLPELEKTLRDDRSATMVMVASSPKGQALRAGDIASWLREAHLGTQVILDTVGELARRAEVRRIPWALVVGADGKWRYDGPAEAMDDSGSFVVEAALRRAAKGLSTPRAGEEGDGCPLVLERP
jgi:hypothetical protein